MKLMTLGECWQAFTAWRARRRAKAALARERELYAFMYWRWIRRNQWRYPPPEGWQVGYNCSHVPWQLEAYVSVHNAMPPPTTLTEIFAGTGLDPRRFKQLFSTDIPVSHTA